VYETSARNQGFRRRAIAGVAGCSLMKSALRVIALLFAAFIGLWVLGHGIVLAAQVLRQNQHDIEELVESSVSIAGGICVLSVAVEQLYCWRARRKDDSLI
jgi:hypothetical protein